MPVQKLMDTYKSFGFGDLLPDWNAHRREQRGYYRNAVTGVI